MLLQILQSWGRLKEREKKLNENFFKKRDYELQEWDSCFNNLQKYLT